MGEGVDVAGLGKRQVLGEGGGAHVVHRVVRVHTALRASVVIVAVVVVTVVAISTLLLDGAGVEDLDLTAEDHLESLPADGLVDAGKARAIAPFVEFATKGVGLELEKTELTSGEEAVPARSVYVGDGGVDDGGLGGTADLGEVGEEGRKILREREVRASEGRAAEGKKRGLTKKRPLRVSRRARSTALWVALRSAVLARLLGLRLG